MIVRTIRLLVDVVVGGAAWALLVPWCWGVLAQAWRAYASKGAPPDEYALFAGLTLGLLGMVWTRPNHLLHTWLHETAHALMCVLLFVRVGAISATAGEGGETRHAPVGPLRTVPILIAPYILPMILGPLLLARWLCPPGSMQGILAFLCGVGILMHLHGLWLNLRYNSFGPAADIPRVGHLLAYALVVSSLLLLAAASAAVLWGAQPPTWWRELFD